MILPAVVLVLLVTVPLAGGRLGRLAELRVRAVWAVACSIALQLLIVDVAASFFPSAVASGLHLASYALVGWFVVANRRIRGLWIVASGGAMNLAALNVANAIGAWAGRQAIAQGYGLLSAVWAGFALTLAGLVLFVLAARKPRHERSRSLSRAA